VYEKAGHGLHWEEPERFAGDLVAFAERLAGSRHGTDHRSFSALPETTLQ